MKMKEEEVKRRSGQRTAQLYERAANATSDVHPRHTSEERTKIKEETLQELRRQETARSSMQGGCKDVELRPPPPPPERRCSRSWESELPQDEQVTSEARDEEVTDE